MERRYKTSVALCVANYLERVVDHQKNPANHVKLVQLVKI